MILIIVHFEHTQNRIRGGWLKRRCCIQEAPRQHLSLAATSSREGHVVVEGDTPLSTTSTDTGTATRAL